MTRSCYKCEKEIPNVEGKYFCSRECWESWANKNYGPEAPDMITKMREKLAKRRGVVIDEIGTNQGVF